MIEIFNRYTAALIYKSETANTIAEAVSEAVTNGASLVRASLVRASLDGARLDGASLDGASLDGASLDGASLVRASLVRASLDGARLDGARLDGARLVRARLDGASLDGASLVRASLVRASLDGARLDGARLDGARLDGARLDGARGLNFAHCPEEGDFVGWKACQNHLVKLQIPAHADRTSSIIGRKCRASEAVVLAIYAPDGTELPADTEAVSRHDPRVRYRVGETVKPDCYDPDPRVECSHGIHFYITRNEALAFGDWQTPAYRQPKVEEPAPAA